MNRRGLAFAAALAWALLPAPAPAATEEVDGRTLARAIRVYSRAAHALQAGNVTQAHRGFDEAVRLFPTFPEAHAGRGHVAMAERRFGDARDAYQTAVRAYDEIGGIRGRLDGWRYAQAQRRIQGLRSANQQVQAMLAAARIQPDKAARMQRANEAEIRVLEEIGPPALRRVEVPPEIRFHLGNAEFHLGRYDLAVASWQECVRRRPEFVWAYNNLAVGYWKLGRPEDALTALEKAEALGWTPPGDLKAQIQRSRRSL